MFLDRFHVYVNVIGMQQSGVIHGDYFTQVSWSEVEII